MVHKKSSYPFLIKIAEIGTVLHDLNFKSQSAMEYLMTYGWAILIIAIVMVAMFQLGIFNASEPRVSAGACEVYRSAASSPTLTGECQGVWPQFVAKFNGVNSYVNFGNNAALSPEAGNSGQMTLCMWYNVISLTDYHGPLLKGEGGPSSGNAWEYTLDQAGNKESFTIWNAAGTNIAYYAIGALSIGSWIFSCFTYNYAAQQAYYYVNGVRYTTNTAWPSGPATAGTGNLVVGYGEGGYSNIEAANLQIYNISLSQSEITALYQEGIGGAPINPTHIVGWWPLNGNAQDYSGNNNQGTAAEVSYTSAWTSGYTQP